MSESSSLSHSVSSPAFDRLSQAGEQSAVSVRRWWFPRWVPTSGRDLEQSETRLLQLISNVRVDCSFVPLDDGNDRLRTVRVVADRAIDNDDSTPLVLLHGFGGGAGLWVNNVKQLSEKRVVYAIDLLGFGRSSRPKFSSDAALVELEWVASLEQWRAAVGVKRMILLGHSLGGFLAASYALEYPDRVRHLILADPWGMPPKPDDEVLPFRGRRSPPRWMRAAATVLTLFNPLASMRAAGPWGPRLVRKARPDLGRRYSNEQVTEDTIFDYIYHCNAQKPSGETAFRQLLAGFGWAKRPMRDRILNADPSLPISFLYGENTWMDTEPGHFVAERRSLLGAYVGVAQVDHAGHQLFADNPTHFNKLVSEICALVDCDADKCA